MKKRLSSKISNRVLYSLIALVIIALFAVSTFAVAPNPGHTADQIDLSGGINSDVVVNGDVTVEGGNLDVQGNTVVSSDLNVYGDTILGGDVNIGGEITTNLLIADSVDINSIQVVQRDCSAQTCVTSCTLFEKSLIGGGCKCSTGNPILYSYPGGNNWNCKCQDLGNIYAYAICI